ncbi:phosphate ABC transporter permease subunit PstC [Desertimonas flava]|uniref:phosphate ABC transporter permease subunit PstC n=1 Tax=Desertimonas flava TaxID=2064846 RepID=UPI000E3519BA|nr:phosphate ABC transporter permease subunit PstC [Desertimonas flava]
MLTVADLQGSRSRRRKESAMRTLFRGAALASVLVSLLIVFVLVRGALNFLSAIDWDWGILVDTGWYPRRSRFDLLTIVQGTLVMSVVAMVVAVPFGLGTAVYLSEYAPRRVRQIVKPVVEVLAGIPSVVVGFFVLSFVAPDIVNRFLDPTSPKTMLAAGIGIGILVIPIMASVSEDAISAVPGSLREASYAVGARKVTTVVKVVLPAAVSGLVAAFIIAVSRAIGETLVATMAGGYDGSGPRPGFSPLEPGMSMTAAMTSAAGGTDQVLGDAPKEVLFFVGLLLFMITLGLNLVGDRFVQRVRQKY